MTIRKVLVSCAFVCASAMSAHAVDPVGAPTSFMLRTRSAGQSARILPVGTRVAVDLPGEIHLVAGLMSRPTLGSRLPFQPCLRRRSGPSRSSSDCRWGWRFCRASASARSVRTPTSLCPTQHRA